MCIRDRSRPAGIVVFSSSRGDEVSYEFDNIRHGAFTAGLLGALSLQLDSVETLRRVVSEHVIMLTQNNQHPTIVPHIGSRSRWWSWTKIQSRSRAMPTV